ncbi:helix-turn-helix domain-containing protein [Pseudomonas sp. PDM13]|uniref:helix-turn-helix domain-containing protein n=1 Tax=Pseudomonas sp. PDM13 TaxID=2769255 RepID=UPI0021E06FA5|nr:helix-turn-helix transcriptional regulator [Pseudomonas sp. PDM13]MCU9951498.1 helix-turn-helix transcriptional regulator [Pseudomonas sp. PDM13]
MMNLGLVKPGEVIQLLCTRLRQERLSQEMTQAEVAGRAGIGVGTLSNLEAGRSVAFDSVVRVAMVLGRLGELERLFMPRLDSLDDILRYEQGAQRRRVKRKARDA